MVADIRAITICNLGTVIQGSIADEAIAVGQGLIRCRGQLVLDGLITPAAGTVVELAYVRDGRIVRIPRLLRVISFFADPFANTTTVQIGDKLVWLENKKPSRALEKLEDKFPSEPEAGDTYESDTGTEYEFNGICWAPTTELSPFDLFDLTSNTTSAGEVAPTRLLTENLRAPITIPASTIALKCCTALGITSTGLGQLLSHYPEGEVTFDNGYVAALEQVLSSESLVGYLNAAERLVVKSLDLVAALSGPQIEEEDIVEIGPIGGTDIPPDINEIVESLKEQDEGEADPEPKPIVASNFRLVAQQQGASRTYSSGVFLANVEYDYYQGAANKVKLTAVSGNEGCTATLEYNGFVIVTANEDFEGTASFSYTATDGYTEATAEVFFEVTEDLPEAPEEQPVAAPEPPQGGKNQTFNYGKREILTIPYGADSVAIYASEPTGFVSEILGSANEVLFRYERQTVGGASVAGNVFKLYLEEGQEPSDASVAVVTTTNFVYDTGVATAFNKPQYCAIGSQCEDGFTLPENPEVGAVLQYGECNYVYTEQGTWVNEDTVPEGSSLIVQERDAVTSDSTATTPQLIEQVTRMWESGYHAAGSINWPTGALPPLDTGSYLVGETYITYSRSAGTTRTNTIEYRARYKTAEGQQYLASIADTAVDESRLRDIRTYSLELVLFDSNSEISLSTNYGAQFAGANEQSGDSSSGSTGTTEESSTTNTVSSLKPTLTPTLPKTYSEQDGYEEQKSVWEELNATTLRYRYARAVHAVATGNRYGMSLQVVPWALPMYPLDPLYLNLRSVVGAYRANGITIAFSSDGILANCDGLFVGGVGGTGTPYFPLPEGSTLEPAPEAVIDEEALPPNSIEVPEGFDPNAPGDVWGDLPTEDTATYPIELTPDYVIPPVIPTITVNAGVRVGMTFQRLNYSLAPVVKDQAIGITLGITARRETLVNVPATVAELLALNPTVSTGYAARPLAADLQIAGASPLVRTGASVAVPVADIGIAPATGPIVPREAIVFTPPTADITVSAGTPVVVSGGSVTVPAANITVAATAPTTALIVPPVFKALTYTGNGSTLSVSGLGFKPSMVWTKRRTSSTGDHAIYDSVRGTTKYWRPSAFAAATTDAASLTAFDADGFTLGNASISNVNTGEYISWCWPDVGSTASNSDGTITTTVAESDTIGLSIFTYTGNGTAGATLGHGLSGTPDIVFIKNLASATVGLAGSPLLATDSYLNLFGNNAVAANNAFLRSYSSTSITIGADAIVNANSTSYVGYAIISKTGKSKVSTYTGTGTTDNSITCGFAPQFVLTKSLSSGDWMYFDSARGVTKQLIHTTAVETTVDKITFDANGFTVKANQNTNTNAQTFLYMAFA